MNSHTNLLSTRSPSLAVLLCLLSVVHAARELPGPLTVQVISTVDSKPVAGVTIHVGGRAAVSDQAGKIVFDGVPAGRYELSCRQPGHLEFRETIELPNGVRFPQTVSLVPEVLSPLKLLCVEEATGEPVGCARIRMVPKAIAAALRGPLVFSTDGAGNVKEFQVQSRIDTPVEVAYYRNGGILHTVLRQMMKG